MSAKHRLAAAAAMVALHVFGGLAGAQERTELVDRSGSARIEAPVVRALSFAALDVAPDVLSRVFPLPGGGWGVSSRVFDGGVRLFDAAGQPAGVLGRSGEGPGEFGGPVLGTVDGGKLWLGDPRNGRLSVFSSDLKLEGDRRIPGRLHGLSSSLNQGRVLLTGFLYSGTETYAVARSTLDESRDSFGGVVETPNARVSLKVACAASPGEIWTFSNSGGAVNILVPADLSLRQRWTLPSEELRREAPRRAVAGEPPAPQMIGCTSNRHMIWLLIGVADSEWTPETNPARDGAEAYWDTLILAVDPPDRAIVGRKRLDQVCLPIAESEISCVDELQQAIHVRELSLAAPSPR